MSLPEMVRKGKFLTGDGQCAYRYLIVFRPPKGPAHLRLDLHAYHCHATFFLLQVGNVKNGLVIHLIVG